MDQSTTALSVFGGGVGGGRKRWSRGNEMESINTDGGGGVKKHKERTVVQEEGGGV